MSKLEEIRAAAEFSPCRVYRYALRRNIEQPTTPLPFDTHEMTVERVPALVQHCLDTSRTVAFIMLNPSTADETLNDPTIRRCIGFAQEWGFRHLVIGNLFALRSTDPQSLYSTPNPEGTENDGHLLAIAKEADLIVCAWGVHGAHRGRGVVVRKMLDAAGHELHHLGLTKDAYPKHPLYLAKSTQLTKWRRWHTEPVEACESRPEQGSGEVGAPTDGGAT